MTMNVSELTKNTIWTPGQGYDQAQPIVSVLLPTFRRGEDGLLRKVIQSILFQSLENIELIIIDDASTDGTADVIKEAMEADDRVSCLTHPQNIGLPAVSEYEAFVRSKGAYIAFAFDDFVFEHDALQALHEFSESHDAPIVHGYIKWTGADGIPRVLGQGIQSYDRLIYTNFIGNSSVLVRRSIINDVGLYDPHVGLSRVCDWDLWRRMHRKYPIKFIDHLIGEEFGASRSDSLGNTYPMQFEVVQELMSSHRDEKLRPSNFQDYDVLLISSEASPPLFSHIVECKQHFSNKFWFTADNRLPMSPPVRSRPVIGVFGDYDTSSCLMFDGLPDSYKASLNFIEVVEYSEYLCTMVSRCDAIIVVRHFLQKPYNDVVKICLKNNIPIYWLVDDNFEILSTSEPQLAEYTRDNLRSQLRGFSGVLVSSLALMEFAQDSDWHPNVSLFSAIFSENIYNKFRAKRIRCKAQDDELRVAFFGGEFRKERFLNVVIPALARLDCLVKVMVRGNAADYDVEEGNIEIISGGVTNYSDSFLEHWSSFLPHVVVHPRGDSLNIRYKTANVVLQSLYLGAVPVVEEEEAYANIEAGIIKIDGDPESWYRSLLCLKNSERRKKNIVEMSSRVPVEFASNSNINTIENIVRSTGRVDVITYTKRLRGQMISAHKWYVDEISVLRNRVWDDAVKVGWSAAAEAVGADYQRQISDYQRQISGYQSQISESQRVSADQKNRNNSFSRLKLAGLFRWR
jgi:glycosyltransferase involved in cell wall biosynthesis